MQKEQIQRPAIKLAGLSVRTNNKTESDPLQGKIFPCIKQYFHQNLAGQIANRAHPGTTFCAYTDYESDEHGDYTYLVGEEVESFDNISDTFTKITIPAQTYTKFTTEPGAMPDVIKNAWFEIWKMNPQKLGGKRTYQTDFEIYDERASDHTSIVLDIYIGVTP